MIQIEAIKDLPFEGFSELREASEQEGYHFLRRLESEWLEGKNRFSLKGEGLYKVIQGEELVAVGGINRDPYTHQKAAGRIRRFYIKPIWRRKGIGRLLLEYILAEKGADFEEISLRTDTESASLFYEKNGFEKISGHPNQSHRYINNREG